VRVLFSSVPVSSTTVERESHAYSADELRVILLENLSRFERRKRKAVAESGILLMEPFEQDRLDARRPVADF
jgi:hypothetical protein